MSQLLSAVGIQRRDTSEDEKVMVGFVGEVRLNSGREMRAPGQDSSMNESMEVGISHSMFEGI